MRFLAAVLLLAAACGGDEATLEDELVGSWFYERYDGCTVGLTFDGELFSNVVACTLESGSVALEVTGGSYVVEGERVTMDTLRSSCSDDTKSWEMFRMDVADGSLRVYAPTGTTVLERNDAKPGSGQAPYGCFGDDGVFTPGPVREL